MSPVQSFSNDGIRAWELLFSQVFSWPDWGSGPNAGQISFVRTSSKYVRPPFPSACGAKHGARGERRHGDFAGRSFALEKTSLSSVCPTFSMREGSSNKLPIQNRSVSPCLRSSVFGAAGPFPKESPLSDRYSGLAPFSPGTKILFSGLSP